MIEGKSGDYYLLVKLNTIVDCRFDYREKFIPTSIKPVNAALTCRTCERLYDPGCTGS